MADHIMDVGSAAVFVETGKAPTCVVPLERKVGSVSSHQHKDE